VYFFSQIDNLGYQLAANLILLGYFIEAIKQQERMTAFQQVFDYRFGVRELAQVELFDGEGNHVHAAFSTFLEWNEDRSLVQLSVCGCNSEIFQKRRLARAGLP
jgi:hypothetical protein